jgi:hypothetical protein
MRPTLPGNSCCTAHEAQDGNLTSESQIRECWSYALRHGLAVVEGAASVALLLIDGVVNNCNMWDRLNFVLEVEEFE